MGYGFPMGIMERHEYHDAFEAMPLFEDWICDECRTKNFGDCIQCVYCGHVNDDNLCKE